MRYQLVLQFQGDAFPDHGQMIAVENCLTEALGHSATVDGHFVGGSETEVFILTNHPEDTFRQIGSALVGMESLGAVTAAFSEVGEIDLL